MKKFPHTFFTLFLGLSAVLFGCVQVEQTSRPLTPPTPPPSNQLTLQFQEIADWPLGKASNVTLASLDRAANFFDPMVQTRVDLNGRFDVTLPVPTNRVTYQQDQEYYFDNCDFSKFTASDPQAKFNSILLVIPVSQRVMDIYRLGDASKDTTHELVYYDKPVVYSGISRCDSRIESFDQVKFSQGWSIVFGKLTRKDEQGSHYNISAIPVSTVGLLWEFNQRIAF